MAFTVYKCQIPYDGEENGVDRNGTIIFPWLQSLRLYSELKLGLFNDKTKQVVKQKPALFPC